MEFIGTQGIGKTTLNNALQKPLSAHWFFRSDLGQVGPVASADAEVEKLHRDIYFQKIKQLRKRQAAPWNSLTVSRQMSRVVGESLTIMSHDFPRGFLLDEGLFKNCPGEVLKLAGDSAHPLWHQRAFIHLRAREAEVVVARYQARVEERARRGAIQIPPTEAEIRARFDKENVLFDRIVETAGRFGCPVIEIFAEDDTQDNIRKVLAFEQDIRATSVNAS